MEKPRDLLDLVITQAVKDQRALRHGLAVRRKITQVLAQEAPEIFGDDPFKVAEKLYSLQLYEVLNQTSRRIHDILEMFRIPLPTRD